MFSDKLVQKITGQGLENLVLRVHDARGRIFDLAEAARSNPGLKPELDKARAEYALAESALEKTKVEHAGLVALTHLLAAMTQAGKDAAPIRLAIARLLQDDPVPAAQSAPAAPVEPARQAQVQQAAQVPAPIQANGDGTETGTFTVLEARPGKSPGTIRAYCQGIDGSKHAVYAKNGNGQALAGAVGKQVAVKYRQGDKGLIALDVRLAG